MSKRTRMRNSGSGSIGFWTFSRDVLVQAMNKGLFIPAMIGILLLVMVVKMPPKDVTALAQAMGRTLVKHEIWGYCLAVVLLIAWPLSMRHQRKVLTKETRRVSEERTHLQEAAIGKKLESSK